MKGTDDAATGEDGRNDGATTEAEGVQAVSGPGSFKILGEFAATDGAAVLGRNTATSGTPVGVYGSVPNAGDGYGIETPDDVLVGGRINSTFRFEAAADGDVGLRVDPSDFDRFGNRAGGNVTGGLSGNGPAGSYYGTFVGGGGTLKTVLIDQTARQGTNEVTGDYGAVVGGYGNRATLLAFVGGGIGNSAVGNTSTVGGGFENRADGSESTVGGGVENKADEFCATVPGGRDNHADGSYSLAVGRRAKANHPGTFVWSDSTNADFTSTGSDQFLVEANGGVGINENDPRTDLHVTGASGTNGAITRHTVLIEDEDSTNSRVLALKTGNTSASTADNYVTFYDTSDDVIGAIEGSNNGEIQYTSGNADYAEYLPRADPDERVTAGDVVGVVGGRVSKATVDAPMAMVVSEAPVVTGNAPGGDPDDRADHEAVAFVGQVPTKVRGRVEVGDVVVPSGEDDGVGQALTPETWTPDEGPVVGRAWEASQEATGDDDVDEVTRVTVAVGVAGPSVVGAALEHQRARVERLEEENDRLRDRLVAVESAVTDRTGDVALADD